MGYRNFIGSVPKSVYDKYHNCTEKEIVADVYDVDDDYDEDDGFYFRDIPEFVDLHCFGKYCDFDIEEYLAPFFSNPMSWDGDCEFYLASKEVFLKIIDKYHSDTHDYYDSLINGEEHDRIVFLHDKRTRWANHMDFKPYNTSLNTDSISSSWSKEYIIFELVRMYKTFDWDNNHLVYGGS